MRILLFVNLPLAFLLLFASCSQSSEHITQFAPLPERSGPSDEDDATLRDSLKKEYQDQLYHADPWVDVEAIRINNYNRNLARKKTLQQQANFRSGTEIFANSKVIGEWHERGPDNEA